MTTRLYSQLVRAMQDLDDIHMPKKKNGKKKIIPTVILHPIHSSPTHNIGEFISPALRTLPHYSLRWKVVRIPKSDPTMIELIVTIIPFAKKKKN